MDDKKTPDSVQFTSGEQLGEMKITTTEKSKVLTGRGEVDGVFVKEVVAWEPHKTKYYVEDEDAVMKRLDSLEKFALGVIKKAGFKSWDQKVLLIDGVPYRDELPPDLFAVGTSEKRNKQILEELEVKGNYRFCSAASMQPDMSAGKYANLLRKYCGNAREAIENQSFWRALRMLGAAEACYHDAVLAGMEADYVRGRNQKQHTTKNTPTIDKEAMYRDWIAERPNHKFDSDCHLVIAEKYNCALTTVKNYIGPRKKRNR